MLFNSYTFLYGFLPAVLAGYFLLGRLRLILASRVWLTAASLVFYGWWDVRYVLLICGSIIFNYAVGLLLQRSSVADITPPSYYRKGLMIAGLAGNLLLLGWYKYADFLLDNVNVLTGSALPLLNLALPLGISFYTFTQIAYVVDSYYGRVRESSLLNYTLFVTFFPQLVAGPILHHKEMMPQFRHLRSYKWNWSHAAGGCYILCIGLFKKVVIADTLAVYANDGFANAVNAIDSWIAVLTYTLQLYFDFSGYTDMAIGIALLFNIRLPQNFNSPYKAVSIQDFWRRWHITLSRFLRDYIYIPLGGNRKGTVITMRNLMITFLLGGIWHGAGWTFIIWGLLHGAALVVHRLWSSKVRPLPAWCGWLLTFLFINLTWVFFRAENLSQAFRLLKGLAGLNGIGNISLIQDLPAILLLAILMPVVLLAPNSAERLALLRPSWRAGAAIAVMFVIAMLYLNRITPFLYFNF
ncbi:MBOAT family O-acyltransferase [Paenibacillus tarimensis]|uniref:MBOAT family O-acyltransferase n=1 Tax=Paenibacillus tarimensis TaxID=416012 RepID=UPI001F1ED106|nr:MBOAT family protein [Paenibacillus tarimensis]MCF2945023.1 MBOAT family protein [Paenibacillus tarimensis]